MFARRIRREAIGVVVVLAGVMVWSPGAAAQQCTPLDPCFLDVTPDGGSVSAKYVSSGPFTQTFSLFNPGGQSITVSVWCGFSLGSCSLVGSSSVTVGAFQTVTKNVNYSTGSSTGNGTLTLTATDGGEFDQGFVSVPVIGPSVNITSPGSATIAAGTDGQAVFLVQNTGSQAESFSFTCDRTGVITCDGATSPASQTIQPSPNPTQVTVNYEAQSTAGSATIILRVQHGATGTTFTSSAPVTVNTYGVAVEAVAGTTGPTIPPDTMETFFEFEVVNTGSTQNVYDLDCVASVNLTCPDPADLTIGAGNTASVFVTFTPDLPNANSFVELRASSSAGGVFVAAEDSVGFAVHQVGAVVTALSSPPTVFAGTEHSVTFRVENISSFGSNTFTFSCGGTAIPECDASPGSATLDSGQVQNVTATFEVGTQNTQVSLSAQGDGGGTGLTSNDSGQLPVNVVAPALVLTRIGPASLSMPASVPGTPSTHIATFEIENSSSVADVVDVSCQAAPGAPVTCVSASGTESIPTTPPEAPTEVTIEFQASTSPGSGYVRLLAASESGLNLKDSILVTVNTYGVTVAPVLGTSGPTIPPDTMTSFFDFEVVNTGSTTNTYDLQCTSSINLTCDNLADIPISAGDTAVVMVTFTPDAPSSASFVKLFASSNQDGVVVGGSAQVDFAVHQVGAVVTALSSSPTVFAGTEHSVTFQVENISSGSNTFTFSCGGTAIPECDTSPGSAALDSGQVQNVTATFEVGTQSTQLSLSAQGDGGGTGLTSNDSGQLPVNVVAPALALTRISSASVSMPASVPGTPSTEIATFEIENSSSVPDVVTVSCDAAPGAPVTCVSASGTDTIPTTPPEAPTEVTIEFEASTSPGAGYVRLIAMSESGLELRDSILVTVNTYGVTVTPVLGTTGPTISPDTTTSFFEFEVVNTGSTTNTYDLLCTSSINLTCDNLADIPISAGDTAVVMATFTPNSPDANSYVRLRAWSDQDGVSVSDTARVDFAVHQVGATVTALGGAQTHFAGTGGHSATFQVENISSFGSNTFTFSCGGAAIPECDASPESATLDSGQVQNVTATFEVATQSTQVSLSAQGDGGTTGLSSFDSGALTVNVVGSNFVVSNEGPDPVTLIVGDTVTLDFGVANLASITDTFNLVCTYEAPVSGCSPDVPQVIDPPGPPGNPPVPVSVLLDSATTPGTGSVTLIAESQSGVRDSVTVTVSISHAYSVTVSRLGPLTVGAGINATNEVYPFLVTNNSTTSVAFDLDCDSTTPVISCTITGSNPVSLAPQSSDTVVVQFSTSTAGQGAFELIASSSVGSGIADTSSVTVTVGAEPLIVTAPNPVLKAQFQAGPYDDAEFVVQNNGITREFDVTCTGFGVVVCDTTFALEFESGVATPLTLPYYASGIGDGSIRLVVEAGLEGPYAIDSASIDVDIANFAVSVTPDDSTLTPKREHGQHTVDFVVTNTGTTATLYELICDADGELYCISLPASVGLDSAEADTVTLTFGTESPALTGNTLRLRATSVHYAGAVDTGSLGVPVAAHRVALTPQEQTVGIGIGGHMRKWGITNHGTQFDVFSVSVNCSGIAGFCTPVGTVGLDSAETDTIIVDYEVWGASVGDSGMVEVVATLQGDSTVADTSQLTVVVGTQKAPVISVADAGAGPTHERGLCLTMAAGPAAAINCGDLRIVHSLPPRTTLNKARSAQLVYNSRTAAPHALVPVNVLIPDGGITPDSVLGRLAIEVAPGVTDTTETWWNGAPWSPGRAARVVIPYDPDSLVTGLYDYTVEIVSYIGSTPYDTTDTGALTIVNRRDNRLLGVAGWWVSGIEELSLTQNGNRLLWIGGDGSARVYDSVTTGLWMAESLTRPDSIQRVGSRYVRRIPGGTRVEFDATGRHVATINRLEDSTVFFYQNDRLSQIHVPTPSGLADAYWFEYVSGELDRVLPLIWEQQVQIRRSNGRITRIVDAGVDSVTFDYDGAGTLIVARTDRAGTTTAYDYDDGRAVTRISTALGAGDSIVTVFRPFETRGLGVALDTADAYALLDSPRQFISDSTRFWLDRYGAPERIVDGLSNETTIERGDSRFPALATRLTDPTGHVSEAFYNDRGTLDSTRVERESGTSVTQYEWDTRWDFVEKITMPEGEFTEMAYDTTNGNRQWQQDSRGDSTRTTFEYNASDPSLLVRVIGAIGDTTTIGYDNEGNVDSVISPLGFVTEYFKDEVGRDTLIVAPIAAGKTSRQRIVYDIKGRVDTTMTIGPAMSYDTVTVPAETLTVANTYDDAGRVTEVRRRSDPDLNSIGWNISLYTYDAIGRTLVERHHNIQDSTVYDKAGNPVRVITGRGHTIEMKYDPLNRLVRRVVPRVTHAESQVASEIDTQFHLCGGALCPWTFPAYPNSGSSFVTAADTSVFEYDAASRTTRAENRSATVKLTYTTSGLLATDTLIFKDGSGLKYGLNYTYDLNGRRDTLVHPGNLTLGSGIQRYDYTTFGAMESTTSVLGHEYSYGYDAAARVITFTLPIGSEAYQYDIDGRRTRRTVTVDGTVRNRDSLTYDQRGRILTVAPVASPEESWEARMAYAGLGALVFSEFESPNSSLLREEFRTDALGNRSWSSSFTPTLPCNEAKETSLAYNTGRLFEIAGTEPYPTCLPPTSEMFQDTTVQYHDASGNVERTAREEWFVVGEEEDQWAYREGSWNFYAADQKLVARQVNRDTVEILSGFLHAVRDRWGVWEEYEYDALGRRIRKEINRGPEICERSTCISATERYIWDGDQLLYETRSGGGGETQNGTVGYTHGLGLDAPLDLTRQNYSYTDGRAVIPHTNWRGDFASGTFADSAEAFDCVILGCNVAWPAGNQSAFRFDGKGVLSDWMGSLWESKRDESGLMYMRSRYYDPTTGQFTQQDPIGLAGGLNLYGFANGDPVNFNDPFGLCPPCGNRLVGFAFGTAPLPSVGFNPLKVGVGGANVIVGTANAASGSAILIGSAPAKFLGFSIPGPIEAVGATKLAFGISRLSRGAQQIEEGLTDEGAVTAKNVLGLLPFGQEFDDTVEPGVFEWFSTKIAQLIDDPKGTLVDLWNEFFALGEGREQ